MTARAARRGAASGSRTSRPSHSPTSSQRSNVHGRAARAQASGSLQRPCGWNAGPRGESISPGIQEARASPQRPGQSAQSPSGSTGGTTVSPRPSASSLGSGHIRSRTPGPEVGGVRAVGEVDHGSAVAFLDGRPWAPLGARVLGVDGLDRLAGLVQAHLHHLPVARMAAGAHDPAILVVGGERKPPLDPVADPPLVHCRSGRKRSRTRPDRAERRGLARVVHDHRAEQGEHGQQHGHARAPSPLLPCYPARSRLSPRGLRVRSSLRPGDW